MFKSILLVISFSIRCVLAVKNPKVLSESDYHYWPSYQHLEVGFLDTIQEQKWINKDHVFKCWESRGTDNNALSRGEAPLWLEDLGVNLLPQSDPGHNLNFDPSHPEFHKRYLMLINELGKTPITGMVKAAYVGASPSFGDDGIGPHGENNPEVNDAETHVRERLDAWYKTFQV